MSFAIFLGMKTKVYADNAATTKLCEEAFEKMLPWLREGYYNPSGTYEDAVIAKRTMNEARHYIASTLKAYDKEIVFTSGGSEADNLAIIGVMEALKDKGRHLITTQIEHHAVLESCKWLEKHGFRVTYVPVEKNGTVDPERIEKAICDDTVMISVMAVNNELGTIQPIDKVGAICKENNIIFHVDAVQAYGKTELDPTKLNIDLLSASAHKFNGPKGAGFLYVKSGTPIESFLHGGTQERGLIAGTENIAAIVGMAEAARLSFDNLEIRRDYEKTLNSYFKSLVKDIDGIVFNGEDCVPGIVNVTIPGIEGESLLINLDMVGICASTGSACAIALEEPSHVLLAIGKTFEEARASVRFSFNYENTMDDCDYVALHLKESVKYLRGVRNDG